MCLPHARSWSKYLTYIISCKPYDPKEGILSFPYYRWGNGGSERFEGICLKSHKWESHSSSWYCVLNHFTMRHPTPREQELWTRQPPHLLDWARSFREHIDDMVRDEGAMGLPDSDAGKLPLRLGKWLAQGYRATSRLSPPNPLTFPPEPPALGQPASIFMPPNTLFAFVGSHKTTPPFLFSFNSAPQLQFCISTLLSTPHLPAYLWKSREALECFPRQEAHHFPTALLFSVCQSSPVMKKNQQLSKTGQDGSATV